MKATVIMLLRLFGFDVLLLGLVEKLLLACIKALDEWRKAFVDTLAQALKDNGT